MKANFSEELETYLQLFDLKIKSFEKIEHEEALSSIIYKLTLLDDTNLILKIAFDKKKWQRETFFLEKVKKDISVPKIIATIEPTKELNGAILMEFIPGDLIKASLITDDLAYQMGICLAKLHQIPVDFYGDIAEDQILSSTLKSGLFILQEYFERSFKECEELLEKSILNKIKKYFYHSIHNIKELDGPHIVHRDFKPGNIIIKNNQIQALIDFEIAKNGFAEEDFFQMQYLLWDQYPKTKDSFLKGYQTLRLLPDLEGIMPIIRVLKALGAIGFTIERNTYKNIHKFVFDQSYKYLKNIFLNN